MASRSCRSRARILSLVFQLGKSATSEKTFQPFTGNLSVARSGAARDRDAEEEPGGHDDKASVPEKSQGRVESDLDPSSGHDGEFP